jgi:hypothetical protein
MNPIRIDYWIAVGTAMIGVLAATILAAVFMSGPYVFPL